MSRAEAEKHPARNILTRAVGSSEELHVDLVETRLEAGDRILLCSDGLSSMVDDDAILRTLEDHPDLEDACRSLVTLANQNGGWDNVTAVLIRAS